MTKKFVPASPSSTPRIKTPLNYPKPVAAQSALALGPVYVNHDFTLFSSLNAKF